MSEFLIYTMKSTVCLAVFYLFYRLLLSKETFHRFNRVALLSIILLSVLLPFCRITTPVSGALQQSIMGLEQLLSLHASSPSASHALPVAWLLPGIYVAGILFFAGRLIHSLGRIRKVIRTGKKETLEGGLTLVVYPGRLAPFSWFGYIIVSEEDLAENVREILLHEKAHARLHHSWDVLLTELCALFHWFNPAAWLLKQELQNLHEYEADADVIDHGVNARQYQLLLIKKAVGPQLYSLANSFNHSKLKKRISMMLKKPSTPRARLKYLHVLPLTALILLAFARSEVRELVSDNLPKVTGKPAAIHHNPVSDKRLPATTTFESKASSPLVYVDGKEKNANIISTLNPNTIESISVLKDETAIKKYGKRAKNGVILIVLKKNK